MLSERCLFGCQDKGVRLEESAQSIGGMKGENRCEQPLILLNCFLDWAVDLLQDRRKMVSNILPRWFIFSQTNLRNCVFTHGNSEQSLWGHYFTLRWRSSGRWSIPSWNPQSPTQCTPLINKDINHNFHKLIFFCFCLYSTATYLFCVRGLQCLTFTVEYGLHIDSLYSFLFEVVAEGCGCRNSSRWKAKSACTY